MSSFANWQQFKLRYGKYVNPLPSDKTLAKLFPFVPRDMRSGKAYDYPVKVSHEHGVVLDNTNTSYALNAAIDSVIKMAELDGSSISIVGDIPTDVIAKAMNGAADGGGEGGAYFDAIDLKVKSLMESGELYREIQLAYGCGSASAAAANIGVVSASISGANLAAPQVVNLTKASWSGFLWTNMINSLVDIYQSDGTTLRASGVTVQAVTDETKNRLKLFKSGSAATVAATDIIVPTTGLTLSCYGVQAQLENTGSLFGIDAGTYPVWKPVSFSAGSGVLTRAKIGQLAGRMVRKGVRDGGDLLVSDMAFADLAEEADLLQRFNDGVTDVKRQGDDLLEYKTPAGLFKCQVYPFMKQGIAWFFENDVGKRVGSTDLTFATPGSREFFFQELENKMGARMRIYTNQAPLITIPSHAAEITAIVSTGDTAPS